MSKSITMGKVFWIVRIILAAIILFLAAGCKKEVITSDIEYKVTHWPVVKTLEAINIADSTATLNGTVNTYGLSTTVTFEYGTTTSYGSIVTAYPILVSGDSIIEVRANISGLTPETIYHFRVRAENSLWTNFYGGDKMFFTKQTLIDVDGNKYKTIGIGNQTWMAENLRTTHYADGSTIPLVTGDDNWDALTYADKAYCWFNNDSVSNARTYGALYTWSAAMNGAVSSSSSPSGIQGVCPVGWHLPSDQEWTTLTDYLGGLDVAGAKLKETGVSHWRSPNAIATNESGFTALPGGHRSYDAVWWDFNDLGFWWSSTEEDYYRRWYRVIVSTETTAEMYRRSSKDQDGFSVRCVYGGEYKTVMTSTATNISKDGATLNGNVLANNLLSIVTFEYGTSTSYGQSVTAIQSPLNGNSSTNVSAKLTGLTCGVIYHFRIKVENSQGVVYGSDLTFDTTQIPTVTTTSVTDITATTAVSGGNIPDAGCMEITDRGIELGACGYRGCHIWRIIPYGQGTGSFTSNLTGLQPSKRYYVRAYATNSTGTAYGDRIYFNTSSSGK
jgi:uncharacterized protein (TIGR02145 family)